MKIVDFDIFNKLTFKIVFPIFITMSLLGLFLYFFILNTVTDISLQNIKKDINNSSRTLYNVIDEGFEKLINTGKALDDISIRIQKSNTIGKIEDFSRNANLKVIIYDEKLQVFLNNSTYKLKRIIANKLKENNISASTYDNINYYVWYFKFEPWQWNIIIMKDSKDYSGLIKRVQIIYLATGIIVLFISLILVYYLHKTIKIPIARLIAPIKKKSIPNYKGVYEFEFLSKNIEEMMNVIKENENAQKMKAHRITHLLNNTSQGFLSFGIDFLIELEYSNECEKLLEKDLHNKNIANLLFRKDVDSSNFFKETMIDAYNESNELTRTLLLTLLPNVLILNKRALQVEYKVLENNKFMLILTNITEKKKLESKIKKEQQVLKMIVSIASDTVLFYETKENYEEFCKKIKTHVNTNKSAHDNVQAIYILIHTFKGTFAQLYMQDTVKELHKFESKLLVLIENSTNDNEKFEQLLTQSNMIKFMNADLMTIVNTLGEAFLNEKHFYKINKNELNGLEEKLLILSRDKSEDIYGELLSDVKHLKNKSLYEYLSVYPKLCKRLCDSSDKEIYNFDITGDLHILVSENIKPFINSLIHVFRNCCEHGIESKEIRNMGSKELLGRISCEIKQDYNILFITISDDGKGIDMDSVKQKIIQNNLLESAVLEKLSKSEILNYIFNVCFSTTQELSDVSGRGVGLTAVKNEVDKLKGYIEVVSNENEGTQFVFKIPELA